jgi:hypothetical protein
MSMKNFLILLLYINALLVCSCRPNRDIICTEEFQMLTVTVTDTLSQPVLLDEYYVIRTETSERIDLSGQDPYLDSINRQKGIYFLLTDGQMGMTKEKGTEFVFHGMQDSLEIVNEKYFIGNDGCHVILFDGNPEIIVF